MLDNEDDECDGDQCQYNNEALRMVNIICQNVAWYHNTSARYFGTIRRPGVCVMSMNCGRKREKIKQNCSDNPKARNSLPPK